MKEMISPGEKRIYAFQHQAVLHRPCKIFEIPPENGELGYTQENGDIYLAGRHALIAMLPEEMQAFFRCGVFVHETLHQCYTDFAYLRQKLDEQKNEQEMAQLLFPHKPNKFADKGVRKEVELCFGG